MSSYDAVFGGTLIQPASVSYSAIALTADTQLSWPTGFQTLNPVVSAVLYVTPDMAGWKLTLPSAKNTSVGNVFTIHNTDNAINFGLYNFGGALIATVDPNEFKTLLLTDNSTDSGVWEEITTSSGGDDITFNNLNSGNITFTPNVLAGGAGATDVGLGNDLLALTNFGAATGVPTHTALNTWVLGQYTKFDGNPTTVGALAVFSSVDGEIGGGNTGPTLYAGTGLKIDNIRINVNTIETTTAATGLTISSQGELALNSAPGSVISLTATGGQPIIINNELHINKNQISNIGETDDISIIADVNLNLKATAEVRSNSDFRIANDVVPHSLIFDGNAGEKISIFPGNINVGQSYELILPQDSYNIGGGPGTSTLTVDNLSGQMSFSDNYPEIKTVTVILSDADVAGMFAIPFRVLQGIPDKIIVPLSWNLSLFYVAACQFLNGGNIFLQYGNTSNTLLYQISSTIDAASIRAVATNRYANSTMLPQIFDFTAHGGAKDVNGVSVFVTNVAPTFNSTGGDTKVMITMSYTLLDAPAVL